MRSKFAFIILMISSIGLFQINVLAASDCTIKKCDCDNESCAIILKKIRSVDLMDFAMKEIRKTVPSIMESPIPLKFNTNLNEVEKAVKFDEIVRRIIVMTKELPPLVSMEIAIDGQASEHGNWFPMSLFTDVSEEAEYKLKNITYSLVFAGETNQTFKIEIDAKGKEILVEEILAGLNQAQKQATSVMDINVLRKQFNITVSPKTSDDENEKKVNQSRRDIPSEADVRVEKRFHDSESQPQ